MAGPYKFYDRVRETTTTTGTGAAALAGAATGYQAFSAALADQDTCYYCIADQLGGNWEVGEGTYNVSGNTLSRTTVRASSNGGALVSFGGGTKDVFLVGNQAYWNNRLTFSLFDHFADAGNISTSETTLYTDTLGGSVFAANGDKVDAEYACTFVNSTSTKQVRGYFAGTLIFDSGALTISASSEMCVYVTIIRDSSTSVRYMVSANTTGASTGSFAAVGKITGLTLSGSNILKITGTAAGVGAATNDIVGTLGAVYRRPAA